MQNSTHMLVEKWKCCKTTFLGIWQFWVGEDEIRSVWEAWFLRHQVIWTVEKEFHICPHTYTLLPHILEEKYGEVEQLITWNCPFSSKQEKMWNYIRPDMKLAVEEGERLKGFSHIPQQASGGRWQASSRCQRQEIPYQPVVDTVHL